MTEADAIDALWRQSLASRLPDIPALDEARASEDRANAAYRRNVAAKKENEG